MAKVAIRMLGGYDTSVDGRHMTSVPTAFFRLGAYMILSGSAMTVPRLRVAGMLWPDASPEQRSANLRQGLARVKTFQDLHGFRLFEWNHSAITLAEDVDLDCDLLGFLHAVERRDADASPVLCSLYAGDLLADIPESGTHYDQWLAEQRVRLKETIVDRVSHDLSEDAISPAARPSCARRLLQLDPCNEPAYRTLMQDAAEMGDAARAASLYRRCEQALKEQMGVRPSRRTRELAAAITGVDAEPGTIPASP